MRPPGRGRDATRESWQGRRPPVACGLPCPPDDELPTIAPRSRARCAEIPCSPRACARRSRVAAPSIATHIRFTPTPRECTRTPRASFSRSSPGIRSSIRSAGAAPCSSRAVRRDATRTGATYLPSRSASRARVPRRPTRRGSPRSARAREGSPSSRAKPRRRARCHATRSCASWSAGSRRTCCASSSRCAPESPIRTRPSAACSRRSSPH